MIKQEMLQVVSFELLVTGLLSGHPPLGHEHNSIQSLLVIKMQTLAVGLVKFQTFHRQKGNLVHSRRAQVQYQALLCWN